MDMEDRYCELMDCICEKDRDVCWMCKGMEGVSDWRLIGGMWINVLDIYGKRIW